LPPQNLEAERSTLGSILWEPERLAIVAEIVGTGDFFRDAHQMFFAAMLALHDRGIPADSVTVPDELKRRGDWEKCGGDETLTEITQSVPHSANAEYYAGIVREKSIVRQTIRVAEQVLRDGYSDQLEAREVLNRAARSLGSIDVFQHALTDEEMGMKRASAYEKLPIEWLWPNRIVRHEYNLIAGRGKEGKSLVSMAIAAKVSTGGEWWDGSGTAPCGHVFILSAEDDPNRIVVPRLAALGANLDNITILEAKRKIRRPDGSQLVSFTDLADLVHWRDVFSRVQGPVLMIIDPLPSYIGRGVNDRKNSDVRAILDPFIALCKEFGITLVAVTHFGKSGDGRGAADKVLDSIAYVNLARAVHYVQHDPDDRTRRLFIPGPCNYAPPDLESLVFTIVSMDIPDDRGGSIQTHIPQFATETVKVDPDEIVNRKAEPKGKRGPKTGKADRFAKWLRDTLQAGPLALFQIIGLAQDEELLPRPTDHNPKPSFTPLYNAKAMIPALYPGWTIEETEVLLERGTCMRAYRAWGLQAQSTSKDDSNQESDTTEGEVPF
jgi:hypothetical protein